MTANPYSPITVGADAKPGKTAGQAFRHIAKYVAAYLAGVVTCVLFTSVDATLGPVRLWPLYPVLAVPGFVLFLIHLKPVDTFGHDAGHWVVLGLGLLPILCEVVGYFVTSPRLRVWRPLWIGFPVGFVGTVGVYFTAAQSI